MWLGCAGRPRRASYLQLHDDQCHGMHRNKPAHTDNITAKNKGNSPTLLALGEPKRSRHNVPRVKAQVEGRTVSLHCRTGAGTDRTTCIYWSLSKTVAVVDSYKYSHSMLNREVQPTPKVVTERSNTTSRNSLAINNCRVVQQNKQAEQTRLSGDHCLIAGHTVK
jgi:hypothetical protein